MTKSDAIAFFGTQEKLAAALGIGQPSISEWGNEVPGLRQFQLEIITNGKLKADSKHKQPARRTQVVV